MAAASCLVFLTLITISVSQTFPSQPNISDVNALRERLMTGYNKNTNPAPYGETVVVNVSVAIRAIGDLDEQREKLTVVLILSTTWTDQSMVWPAEENNIYNLHMDKTELWVPDFLVLNKHYDISYGAKDHHYLPIECHFFGQCQYHRTLTAETTCELDMENYPFDSQSCLVEIIVDKRGSVEIYPQWMLGVNGMEPDGTWTVTNTSIYGQTGGVGQGSVNLEISFVRKPTFLLVNLIIPMTLLAFLAPLVFLLPNNSGERVGFSITVLLSISVFMTMVADQVPQKSEPLPRLLILLLITYSLTVLVSVIVVINARVYRIPARSRVPRVLGWLHTVTTCCCYCFRRRHKSGMEQEDDADDEAEETVVLSGDHGGAGSKKQDKRMTWKDVSWTIDMCSMILFYAAMIILIIWFYVKNQTPSASSSDLELSCLPKT